MTLVTRAAVIPAPAQRIWPILSHLDSYADWESGYDSSEYTSDQHEGIGTTRRVGLKSPMGIRHATHVVTRWDEGRAIAWAARDSNFPFLATAEQTVTLEPNGESTHVENQVAYALRYGALGRVVDRIMFERVVRGAAEGFLASLAARAKT